MGYFFHFWVKIHSKLNWKFRIKILVCILCQMSDFYLMYNLMCQFVSAQMAVLSTIFQVFIVLVMYNFVHCCLLGRHWKERGSEKKKKEVSGCFCSCGALSNNDYEVSWRRNFTEAMSLHLTVDDHDMLHTSAMTINVARSLAIRLCSGPCVYPRKED